MNNVDKRAWKGRKEGQKITTVRKFQTTVKGA